MMGLAIDQDQQEEPVALTPAQRAAVDAKVNATRAALDVDAQRRAGSTDQTNTLGNVTIGGGTVGGNVRNVSNATVNGDLNIG